MTPKTDIPEVTITRIFNAPRQLVWRAWTDPQHLARWWGPKDFTAPHIKMDLRVGGKYHWCMRAPDGKDYWTTGEFREIDPPEKLVYTDSFSDAQGNVVTPKQYGLPGEWPHEMVVSVTLEDLGDKTRMTLKHTGLPRGEMTDMTVAGWNESFDKMEAGLA